jgi:hypothetical protein
MAVSADSLEVLVAFGADNEAIADSLEVLTAVQEDVVEPPEPLAVEQPKFVVVNT